jgi:hypothetical protein
MPSLSPVVIAVAIAVCLLAAVAWGCRGGADQPRRWLPACICAILLPMAALLRLGDGFGYDWYNHAWMIGYFGEYFRQHHAIAATFNSNRAVGMPQPIFYAFLVYPLAGMLSSVLGAALATRIVLLFATAVQFASVLAAARHCTRHRFIPFLLALSSIGSTYALTNIYNRAAITEYLAVSFLTSAVSLGLLAWCKRSALHLWLAGLLLVLTIGCHPSTALLGCGFVAILMLAAAVSRSGVEGRLWWSMAGTLCLVALVSAPWVYATLRFRSDLGIVGAYPNLDLMSRRTDSLVGRLVPFPTASLWPARTDDLPFIEAPLDGFPLALLLLNLALLVFTRKTCRRENGPRPTALVLAVVAITWAALATFVSVSRSGADLARPVAPYIQFCYRFVSHANLGVLVAALATTALADSAGLYARARRGVTMMVAAAALLMLAATLTKLGHAGATADTRHDSQYAVTGSRAGLITEPRADAAGDYAAMRHSAQLAPAVVRDALHADFSPHSTKGSFGDVPPLAVDCDRERWVVTNVVAFPWNRITVDGRPPAAMLPNRWRWAVKLPKGNHVLRWAWSPDPTWALLWRISWIAFGAAVLATITFGIRNWTRAEGQGVARASRP